MTLLDECFNLEKWMLEPFFVDVTEVVCEVLLPHEHPKFDISEREYLRDHEMGSEYDQTCLRKRIRVLFLGHLAIIA